MGYEQLLKNICELNSLICETRELLNKLSDDKKEKYHIRQMNITQEYIENYKKMVEELKKEF